VSSPNEHEEERMEIKRLTGIILVLLAIALLAGFGSAQQQNLPQRWVSADPEGPRMTVKGTIEYNESLGGYFVHGLEPGGELFIVNQNPRVLDDLLKSGKTLIIEGRIVKGAEYLFIEKVNGQPYVGGAKPGSK
jgi:hypothetical protein